MNNGAKDSRSAFIHMLDGINAEAVQIREGDPVFINLAQIEERSGCRIVLHIPGTLIHVLKVEKVAFSELRIMIEVRDAALLRVIARVLKFDRPDCTLVIRETSGIRWIGSRERYRRLTGGIVESEHGIRIVVPTRVE